jgi:YesN/AraC family two-component response regulator
MRVVIADDMRIQRQQLRRIVTQDLGFDLIGEAADGAEAVALCRTAPCDIVILDLSMPVLTGIQAAEIIYTEKLARHIVVCSSQAQLAITTKLKAMNALFCLKPYSPKQLQAVLSRVV